MLEFIEQMMPEPKDDLEVWFYILNVDINKNYMG